MAKTLGIVEGTAIDVLVYNTEGFWNLSGVQQIYITSQKISDGSNLVLTNGKSEPVIAIVPLTVNFGEIEHWRAYAEDLETITYPSFAQGTSIRNTDLQVRDKYNNILNLGNLDVTVILKLFHNTNS